MKPACTPSSLTFRINYRHSEYGLRKTCLCLLAVIGLPMQALAGGADVSTDEIYSDGVTLTTEDGSPLDINSDGNIDLAAASNRGGASERSRYYPGNGDGTFGTAITLNGGASSEIAAATIDADMIVDLVHARRDQTDRLYLGNGAGLGPVSDISADAFRVLSIALVDLDLDGDIDIVTGNGRLGGVPANPAQVNRYYLNDGNGSFAGSDILADADDTRGIALADIDGDGLLDIIAGNDETTAGSNRIYLNQTAMGTISFAAGFDFGPADDQTSSVLIGDLDNDGDPDIVTLNNISNGSNDGTNRFFINNSTTPGVPDVGTGDAVSADTDRTSGGVLADFDGDGDLDLAVANLLAQNAGESSRNRLYLNQFVESGNTIVSFSAGTDISPDEQMSRDLAAGDLDGDGDMDIVVGNQDDVAGVSGRDRRYLNNGTADPFANVVPVIDSQTGPLETDEDTDLAILLADVQVTDGDNIFPDDFTLVVQSGTGYTVSANTITPDPDFVGSLTVPVVVNDGTGDSNTFNLTVTVNSVNDSPMFTSVPPVDATEGIAYTYDVTTADPDTGDALAITAPVLPGWLTLTDNSDGTATLTGTPDQGDVGDNDVQLQVSDGAAAVTQDFTVTVAAVDDAPVFTSTPVLDATEDAVYTYNVTTDDPDSSVTITAPVLPAWLTLTDNGDGTATLTGTPGDADVGDNDVSLQVDDGSSTASQDFTVAVAGINDTPTFTSAPLTTATTNAAYAYSVVTSDPDTADTLTISALTIPAWLTLTDNGDGTATLAGTPADGDVGDHDVSLEVSDGTASTTQDFTITVGTGTGGNNTPVFTSTAVTDATAGTGYAYDITATDADPGDTLAITAATLPAWLTLTDNGDGTAILAGTPADGDVGDHDVVLRVSDGTDETEQAFTIAVSGGTSGNNAPSFTSTPITEIDENVTYTYEVIATDPDPGDTLEITAPTLPTWLTLTDNGDGTASLTGTPTSANVGEHEVSLEVSDGSDTATQDFSITVSGPTVFPPPTRSGGGGSAGLLSILGLLTAVACRRRRVRRA